ncbi:MAG: inosine/xanthosine triphosphatase [Candidatus Aenigmarchaeota archaeon]|nr:inosine/xanthosine triphosphatase [Candidatus Aenigmarchaeota archaeon]
MRINVGSTNSVKVDAIKEIISDYEILSGSEVIPVKVSSQVSEQPKTLDETIQGARNRAEAAFHDCDYSIGIESGLMQVPKTKTGHMNIDACAIYDGKEFHIGLGSGFEYPKEVTRLVFEEGLDIDDAFHKAGITDNDDIGSFEGAIGILTKGRLPRKEYTKQAIRMALIHLENENHFLPTNKN